MSRQNEIMKKVWTYMSNIKLRGFLQVFLGIIWLTVFVSRRFVFNHSEDFYFIHRYWYILSAILGMIISIIGIIVSSKAMVKILFAIAAIIALLPMIVLIILLTGGSLV
jgi:hypothetical protein